MKPVEKQGNVFSLMADPAEKEVAEARSAHPVDCQMLSAGSVTPELLAGIVLRLAKRLLDVEQHR